MIAMAASCWGVGEFTELGSWIGLMFALGWLRTYYERHASICIEGRQILKKNEIIKYQLHDRC